MRTMAIERDARGGAETKFALPEERSLSRFSRGRRRDGDGRRWKICRTPQRQLMEVRWSGAPASCISQRRGGAGGPAFPGGWGSGRPRRVVLRHHLQPMERTRHGSSEYEAGRHMLWFTQKAQAPVLPQGWCKENFQTMRDTLRLPATLAGAEWMQGANGVCTASRSSAARLRPVVSRTRAICEDSVRAHPRGAVP